MWKHVSSTGICVYECIFSSILELCWRYRCVDNDRQHKFDGLELNHIPRWHNEAADTLAKVVSGREPVPTSIFASDQYKPSVRYEKPE
jgi:hypothetical protein